MIKIKNFSLTKVLEPFMAPELCHTVGGEVYGHPVFPDGSKVTTSKIKEVRGRVVRTQNTEYRLYGRPDRAFLQWLKGKGIEYDPKNPLKGLENYWQ